MTFRDLPRPGGARFPLAALLCAVVLGIVGMHGLGPAAAEHPGYPGHHAGTVSLTAQAPQPADADTWDEQTRGAPAADAGVLALCLMVLGTGLGIALLLLVGGGRGGAWQVRRLVDRVVAAVAQTVLPPPGRPRSTVLRT